jgi:thiosulfate/3-mercaptopyruvate sulfurtransferase
MFKTLIEPTTLVKEHNNTDWLIFDVRYDLMNKSAGREAYLQGHIPGAIYVDLHDDLSRLPATNRGRHPLPSTETMNSLFSELGIHSDAQVIVYDNVSGAFAARLWWMLKHMQHENVAVLDGGWQSWLAAGGPISSEIETPRSSSFNNTPLTSDVINIDQVQDFELIVDAREPARYRGESEPIDHAAGHIPGAINRFWKDNLSENGCFKEKDVLRQEFEAMLNDVPSKDAVFYCGSGVTACHNLLAAVHAGLDLPKLYAGSWSEWSSTPDKPVATG